MFRVILLLALNILAVSSHEKKKPQYEDPFAILDRHISHTLAHHAFWPWSQLMKAAAALDDEDNIEPQIGNDPNTFRINMNVKRFKPEELMIKVKNNNVIVEGKHKETGANNQRYIANHFVQHFALPPGSKQDEVTAVLKNNGLLMVSAPRHELPPPPPERIVPIEIQEPETTTEKEFEPVSFIEPVKETDPVKPVEPVKEVESAKEVKPAKDTIPVKETEPVMVVKPVEISSTKPIDQLDVVEATTHVGKIRKKELKTTKTAKDNEVAKGLDGNGLDYTLAGAEE